MTYRVNGIGTTIAPMPDFGQYSIAMYWFTFIFIPIIPLGWRLVKGMEGNKYLIIKRLSYAEAKSALGTKGMLLTLGYGFFINTVLLCAFMGIAYIFSLF